MTGTVVIAFPRSGKKAEKIARHIGATVRFYKKGIFEELFSSADRIVALMATGIVVRSIAPLLSDKWKDPAVVVVSPDLSCAIPVVGGHHGANDLVRKLAQLGIRPALTTATDVAGRESVEGTAARYGFEVLNRESTRQVNAAILDGDVPVLPVSGPAIVLAGPGVSVLLHRGEYIIGIGCRKGVLEQEVLAAVRQALADAAIPAGGIFVFATTAKKIREQGLLDAVRDLSSHLIFLDDETVNAQEVPSPSRAGKIGLSGVAEPCALALAKNRELVMKKTVFGRVTIAIAR